MANWSVISQQVTGLADGVPENRPATSGGREYLGIRFRCCGVYQRIYRNAKDSAYVGWCPRCARKVEVKIGPAGTSARFFDAY